jgi:hypothetical protein
MAFMMPIIMIKYPIPLIEIISRLCSFTFSLFSLEFILSLSPKIQTPNILLVTFSLTISFDDIFLNSIPNMNVISLDKIW